MSVFSLSCAVPKIDLNVRPAQGVGRDMVIDKNNVFSIFLPNQTVGVEYA